MKLRSPFSLTAETVIFIRRSRWYGVPAGRQERSFFRNGDWTGGLQHEAPLILTDNNKPTAAVNYGTGLISDKVVKNIFSKTTMDIIAN